MGIDPNKSVWDRMDRAWLTLFPWLCFAMGCPTFLYEVFIDRPRDPYVLGISAIACGLAPVGAFSLAGILKGGKQQA